LTGQSTQDRCTILSKRSQVLLSNILGSVKVCIQAVATLTAKVETLRTAIGTMLIATTGTHLGGVPGVNLDHSDPFAFCLVLDNPLGEHMVVVTVFLPMVVQGTRSMVSQKMQ
jgi:hypothetical protein